MNRPNHIAEFRVYNVKQGNMNSIHLVSDDSIILFDHGSKDTVIGIPYNLNYSKVKILIISHFHDDHFNLIDPKLLTGVKYVVLPIDHIPKKLILILKRFPKSTVMIPLDLAKYPNVLYHGVIGKMFHFFTGPYTQSNINNRGIVLNTIIKDTLNSYTGDIKWRYYTKTLKSLIYKKISVVVPHHGGAMGSAKPIISGIKEDAIYSHGNHYAHPLPLTRSIITHYGFNQLETSHISTYCYYYCIL